MSKTVQIIISVLVLLIVIYLIYKHVTTKKEPAIVKNDSQRIYNPNPVSEVLNCGIQQKAYDEAVTEMNRLQSIGADQFTLSAQQRKVNAAALQLENCKKGK